MKYFKNKFFIVLFAAATVLIIFTTVFSAMGLQNQLKNFFNTLATPVRWCVSEIKEAFEGFGEYFSDMDSLIEENGKLKEEIQSLEDRLNEAIIAEEENERLKEYLEVKRIYNDYKFTDALVIGHEAENYMTIITLNRGTGDGIEIGMPVITSSGVVGSVCEVGYSWCKVRTVIEASASVGAYVSRSGEVGIIQGDISYKESGLCRLEYLDEDADVEVGDLIYTSGTGSVYPRGLPIGEVVSVGVNEYTRTKYAEVRVFSELDNLKYVMIVTEFEIYSEEESLTQENLNKNGYE